MTGIVTEFIPNQIWIKEYPIRYAGCTFNSRMTIVRLSSSQLMIHSPCKIDCHTRERILSLGEVAFIVAPGSYHYFYIRSAQQAFPNAKTFVCPGVSQKCRGIKIDGILDDNIQESWQTDFEQVLIRGSLFIKEVAFFHKPSKTLILTDLIENFTDKTGNVNWILKIWWKVVFQMWNNPKPAPEYQLGWINRRAAKQSLKRVLEWDFEKIIIAHGELIESNAKGVALRAWKTPIENNYLMYSIFFLLGILLTRGILEMI